MGDSPNAIRNRANKDRKRRAKLRAKLQAEGVSEALIEKIIDQQRKDDLAARHGDHAREVHRSNAARGPDDTGYHPTTADPLLRGAARVQGKAAKVVSRRQTITKYQYDRLEGEPDHG
jgi:hypothetical protein